MIALMTRRLAQAVIYQTLIKTSRDVSFKVRARSKFAADQNAMIQK
jgi:hypothetical protein